MAYGDGAYGELAYGGIAEGARGDIDPTPFTPTAFGTVAVLGNIAPTSFAVATFGTPTLLSSGGQIHPGTFTPAQFGTPTVRQPKVLIRSALTSIRELPPLRLTVAVATPAGYHARWGHDDPRPSAAPSSLTFTTTMPGGFEDCTLTLQREPSRSWADLEELASLTVLGAGGKVAWQGRLEQIPGVAGDQAQINPQAVGWQSHLADDTSAREIFVDRDVTQWQGPSISRQIKWLREFGRVSNGASVGPDFSSGYPSLTTELQGPWTQPTEVTGWYDAHGLAIGHLYFAWESNDAFQDIFDRGDFLLRVMLDNDDVGAASGGFSTDFDHLEPTGHSGQRTIDATAVRRWAAVEIFGSRTPDGKTGVSYSVFWTALGVYGAHGLPRHGQATRTSAKGLLASDIVAYALGKWAPKIACTVGKNGTIKPSSFVIPQSVYLDPTTAAVMINDATQYELLDWAVWEHASGVYEGTPTPTFYMNPRGQRGTEWRARTGPAQLQNTGPQISNLWNGLIVQWTDVTGVTRTVGPPGANCNWTDSTLLDTDPGNPANQADIRRWGLLTLGTATKSTAVQIGQLFLEEQKQLNTGGQAALTGYVQDSHGVLWPAWMVRAGDTIRFIDSQVTSPRRIVATSYDDSSKVNTIQLDQPPDPVQALLQRMSIVLSTIGLG